MSAIRRWGTAAACAAVFAALSCAAALAAGAGRPAPAPPPARDANPLIAVIPIHGEIDGLAARSFGRRLDDALAERPRFVVLDMDTWGGELQAAFDITDRLKSVEAETIALVTRKAISAGALISLAARSIAMMPDTRIGDCEPITIADGEMKTAPEKVKSVLRSDFENFARRNGYPVALAVAMVDKDIDDVVRVGWEDERGAEHVDYVTGRTLESWSRDEKRRVVTTDVIVPKGQLLTMGAEKAAELGFASIVHSREDLFRSLERKAGRPLEVRTFDQAAWEPWAGLLTNIGFQAVMLFLGILGIAIEVTHPGMVAPGALGLAAVAIACGGGYMAGRTSPMDMALVAVGIVLLALELFVIPGFGVVGLSGIALIIVGGFLSLQSFGLPTTVWEEAEFRRNLKIFAGGFVGTICALGLALRYLPQSPVMRRVVLASAQRPEDGYTVASSDTVALLGRKGTALTDLRPAGKIMIGEERHDAVADGQFIDKGTPIEVVDTSENRIVVRSVKSA
jgi:membrane-bound serine protease (ClpP class)